jgi:hypothetical protein
MSEARLTTTRHNATQPEAAISAAISAANDMGTTVVRFHDPSRRPFSYGNDRARAPPLCALNMRIALVHPNRKESSEWRRYRY